MHFPLLISVNELIPIFIVIFAAIVFTIIIYIYIRSSISELKTDRRDIELIDQLIDNKNIKTIRRRKVGKTIKNILFYGFLIFIIPFIIYVGIAKIKGSEPKIGNTTVMVVGSGSMSFIHPDNDYYLLGQTDKKFSYQFNYGDIILLKEVKSDEDLEIYDVICYYDQDKAENIIHRIRLVDDTGINIKYTTRGDANNKDDDWKVVLSDVIGEYHGTKIPFVGRVVLFLQNSIGIATVISLLYLLIVVDSFLKKLSKKEDLKMNKFEKIIGYNNLEVHYYDQTNNLINFDNITIYYLDTCYVFNKTGFVRKTTIDDQSMRQRSKEVLIKSIYYNGLVVTYEYKINNKQ